MNEGFTRRSVSAGLAAWALASACGPARTADAVRGDVIPAIVRDIDRSLAFIGVAVRR